MIEVEIEDEAWSAALRDVEAVARRAAEAVLTDRETTGDVTLLLTDDEAIAELNAQFRHKDGPTNVLSVPAAVSARPHIGDVALASGVCAREARAQGKTLENHLTHLVAHGVLHLLGYDHMTDAEADEMEALERSILTGLGAPDPYASEDAVFPDDR
jgi:probable rRNA maturation factor